MTNKITVEQAENGYIVTDENGNSYVFVELDTMVEAMREWYK